ncbi:MCE family protein MceE [Nocardia nova SH22a]|uniref:MCE family protein MceE n=1 Tax=Nocardia nova SH22a TaxID=1415166 RepID=W5TAT8_9NOCA|nr:MCE family protein [Nocardia nova]AHH16317.1 MCE family protein MceE [Nocardia nova SH22a]
MTTRIARTFTAALTAALLAGCTATVDNVPLPKPGAGGPTYRLHALFDNALNLPEQARIRVGGTDIGVVGHIGATNFLADVELDIRDDVHLPRDTRVELRQPTPLGDLFVAVILPEARPGTPMLRDGDTIGRDHTSAGASVEELMMSISMLLGGGALEQVAHITSEMNSMLAGRGPRLAHLLTELTATLTALDERTGQIDGVLHGLDDLTTTLAQRRTELGQAADTFPPLLGVIAENNRAITTLTSKVSTTMAALGDFTSTTGPQFTHLFDSVQKLMDGFTRMGGNLSGALDRLHAVQPGLLASTRGSTLAVGATVSYLDIGALTDPHGSKVPDGSDLGAFAGSLAEVLGRVLGRLQGGQR